MKMLVMGHAIITLSAATVMAAAITPNRPREGTAGKTIINIHQFPQSSSHSFPSSLTNKLWSWFSSLGKLMDIRFLLIGSLLPDIIDKPIGHYFFRETFGNNGRILGHTLLFLMVIILSGIILYVVYRKNWFLVFSFGTFFHLILDQMWLQPTTLLWPLYGPFEKYNSDFTNWLQGIFSKIINDPLILVPEMIGLAVALCFVLILWRKGMLYNLIRYGRI